MKLCEDELRYSSLEHLGELESAVKTYARGQRSSSILDTLAYARVWSYNLGRLVPLPPGLCRSKWNHILDSLVIRRLGDRRCLDCGNVYWSSQASVCFIGLKNPIKADRCPQWNCRGTTTEEIKCTKGIECHGV